jgi:hypothetical protein
MGSGLGTAPPPISYPNFSPRLASESRDPGVLPVFLAPGFCRGDASLIGNFILLMCTQDVLQSFLRILIRKSTS